MEGIKVSESKIEAIKMMPRPTKVRELQTFLGVVNFYSKFVMGLTEILSPLYQLLKKNVKWEWSGNCERAFELIKEKLVSSEILMQYDPKLPVKITTDASPHRVGAVLSHVLKNGDKRPIAYASRTLSKAEIGYSQLDREALGLVYGVKTFQQYVYGRPFTLETDHKPLIFIFGDKKGLPQMAAARVQR